MRRFSFLTAAACCLLSTPAIAGEEVLFGPAPDWVVEFNRVEPSDISIGELPVHAQLSDFQSRLEEDRVIHFVAYDVEFLMPQGLSAGDISLSWRPEFDELTVHQVLIKRGDDVIDVMEEGQTFTVLRREQNLDAAMLTGVLTANMFPAGLEVGDVLSVAYTVESKNSVTTGYPEAVLGPLNGFVDQSHVRLSWPRDIDIELAISSDLPEADRGRDQGYDYAALTMAAREPLVAPAGAPPRYQLVRMFEATSFDSWGELAQLFVPLYQSASQIPAEGPLRDELEEIRAATSDPVERAELALALVQDKVRYVALAMGAAGLVPSDTATTWARRFGDCKAKSALLIGLLNEMGIEAEPILVHSTLGDALPGRLPMVSAFDHVLVRARINGQEYFLDGTKTGETSLARLTVPNFSWGLPVLEGGAELVPMVAAPLREPDQDFVINIDASGGLRVPAPASLEVIYRGDTAIFLNSSLVQLFGQSRQQTLEQFWRERYGELTLSDTDMRFDADTGQLHLTATGTLEMDWGGNDYEPYGVRVGYTPDFTRAEGPASDAPFAIVHPYFERTSQTITLPDGFSADQLEGENVEQSIAGMEYRRELSLLDSVFTSVRSRRSLAPEFAAAEADQAEDVLEGLWDKRVFINVPAGYRMSQDEIASMSQARGNDVDDLIDQGVALMDASEWQAALNVFNRVVDLAPNNEWGLANRAVTQASLGAFDQARSDADAALAIDPESHVAYHAIGIVADARFDAQAAIEAYSRAIEFEDGNSFALQQRARAYQMGGRLELAMADVETLIEMSPEYFWGYVLKGYVLTAQGKGPEVLALFEDLIVRFPENQSIPATAASMLTEIGMTDAAQRFLTQAPGNENNPVIWVQRAQMRADDEGQLKLDDLNRALEINPDFVPALNLRADYYWQEYDFAPALVDIDRVLELAPKFSAAYATRVMILMDQENQAEAIATVDRMVEISPADGIVLRQAARLYGELDAWTKQERTQARAEEILPEDDYLALIRRGPPALVVAE